jgi:hypothetical protein
LFPDIIVLDPDVFNMGVPYMVLRKNGGSVIIAVDRSGFGGMEMETSQ